MRALLPLFVLLVAACATTLSDEPLIKVRDNPDLVLSLVGSDGTFLGCLSCGAGDARSIVNRHGVYGSPGARESIFNGAGPFGSKLSPTSACSPRATEPPMIVGSDGREYGHLTLNAAHPEAVRDPQLVDWLRRICLHVAEAELDPGCGCPKPRG